VANFSQEYLEYAKQMLGKRNELAVELATLKADIDQKKVDAGIDKLEDKAKKIKKELDLLPDQVLCKATNENQGKLFAEEGEDGKESDGGK
jgi:hypothetical protein